jgi:propionyl-CoA carboxylase alpha chain
MIKKLLIANRGEIACRIIKTAKKMGIHTIAVYSDADANALHVKLADKAIYIGAAPAHQSYLNINQIIAAIKISGADAVHPGYGFLSENGDFADALEKNKITFVGPSADAIRKMGDKIEAKKIAKAAKVNIVPGFMGVIKSPKEAMKVAGKIGYPIMLKAAAGGGGKGMRVVRSDSEMQQAFSSTRNEARNNFSDERTFIEKFIENPRHIEVQLLADKHGNYVCLGERECSIQRHHQKVIEEAPSPFIDPKTRKKLYAQSVALAKKVGYFSAGTIEYIVDQNKNFYFLEMNTRLQVEHPVTELITGVDLVEEMIKIADGQPLSFKQNDIKLEGWAMESRIYAEDPTCGFLPSTGRITTYIEPASSLNVRVDTGVYDGGEVSMFYDAMIAKLCTYAPTRGSAIEHMKQALGNYVIRGISHNISFLQAIFSNARFASGDLTTHFIEQEYKEGFMGAELSDEQSAVLLCATVFLYLTDMKRALNIEGQMRGRTRALGTRWVVRLGDTNYPVTVRPIEHGYKISFETRKFYITSNWLLGNKLFQFLVNGKQYSIQIEYIAEGFDLSFMGSKIRASMHTPRAAELYKFMKKRSDQEDATDVIANISGMVREVKVTEGEAVTKGQPVVILEAMKMENVLTAATEGIVRKIQVKAGDNVNSGELLVEIEAEKAI